MHRDLKPENVMISAEGHIKVADFGIAKAYDQVATGDFMTSTCTTVGTPTYMAPEQAMGSNIGPWTDLYSAGVMAYELFVGQLPFPAAATPMAMLLHHINDPVPEPRELNPELHPDLERWILGLLDKLPEKRTGSAMEAWETLEEVALGLFGPRWRRQARLLELAGPEAPAEPLTPAPFESAPHKSPGQLDVVPVVPPDPESSFVTFDPPAVLRPESEQVETPEPLPAPEPQPPAPEPEPPAPVEPKLPPDPTPVSGYVTFEPPYLPAPSLPDASTDEHDDRCRPRGAASPRTKRCRGVLGSRRSRPRQPGRARAGSCSRRRRLSRWRRSSGSCCRGAARTRPLRPPASGSRAPPSSSSFPVVADRQPRAASRGSSSTSRSPAPSAAVPRRRACWPG